MFDLLKLTHWFIPLDSRTCRSGLKDESYCKILIIEEEQQQ